MFQALVRSDARRVVSWCRGGARRHRREDAAVRRPVNGQWAAFGVTVTQTEQHERRHVYDVVGVQVGDEDAPELVHLQPGLRHLTTGTVSKVHDVVPISHHHGSGDARTLAASAAPPDGPACRAKGDHGGGLLRHANS